MRLWRVLVAVATLGSVTATAVEGATLVNFNSQSGGGFTDYTEAGATFSPVGGGTFDFLTTPNGTVGLLASGSPRPLLRASIAGGASEVAVDVGDFNADPDGLLLRAFSSLDVLLASATLATLDTDVSMHTLLVSAPNIAYVIFGSEAPSVNGSSVYADNFAYTANSDSITPMPEPATMILFGLGVAGMGAVLSRQQRRQRRRHS
jgi:hypothetical protein